MTIAMTTGHEGAVASARVLRLSAESRPLRRSLGPTAWAVLEEMALDADADEAGVVIASTNVRDLAEALGLVKDTVARALNRLIVVGVVARRPQHQSAGRFGAVVYDLRLPAGLSISPCPEIADTIGSGAGLRKTVEVEPCPQMEDTARVLTRSTSSRRDQAARARRSGCDQLSLLDDEVR
jgi:hypothetical protein